jgi:hypothetical protein
MFFHILLFTYQKIELVCRYGHGIPNPISTCSAFYILLYYVCIGSYYS